MAFWLLYVEFLKHKKQIYFMHIIIIFESNIQFRCNFFLYHQVDGVFELISYHYVFKDYYYDGVA